MSKLSRLTWHDLDAIKLAAGMGEGEVKLSRTHFDMLLAAYEDSQQEIYELKQELEAAKKDNYDYQGSFD